ncbi:hypothetical protein PGTUg99_035613 [Puccinia graminis f. sp. tritici]|uniref:Uncharacterized protein n=1 Tax=Puccinia graminis f. sp. tritici TaxID=56615 RepID=A0A5B0QUX3_PUCGR|nr:hypothetical protein PGTUg99_035613 [Puccinia graminis f. sp. tritici]
MNVFIPSFAILVLVFQVTMTDGACNPQRIESCAVLGPQAHIYPATVEHPCSGPGSKWCCPVNAFKNSMTPPLKEAHNNGCRAQPF